MNNVPREGQDVLSLITVVTPFILHKDTVLLKFSQYPMVLVLFFSQVTLVAVNPYSRVHFVRSENGVSRKLFNHHLVVS